MQFGLSAAPKSLLYTYIPFASARGSKLNLSTHINFNPKIIQDNFPTKEFHH